MQFCITGKRKPCRYEIRQCKILPQRNLALLHPPSIRVLFPQQPYQTQHSDIALSSYQFSREVRYHYKQFQAHQNLDSSSMFQSPHLFPTIINSLNFRTLALGIMEYDLNIYVCPTHVRLWEHYEFDLGISEEMLHTQYTTIIYYWVAYTFNLNISKISSYSGHFV